MVSGHPWSEPGPGRTPHRRRGLPPCSGWLRIGWSPPGSRSTFFPPACLAVQTFDRATMAVTRPLGNGCDLTSQFRLMQGDCDRTDPGARGTTPDHNVVPFPTRSVPKTGTRPLSSPGQAFSGSSLIFEIVV